MIVLGFILIIVAVVAAVILITQNAGTLDVHAIGLTWSINAYWLVVAGLVATAVAVLGLAMVRHSGVRTSRARHPVPAQAADEVLMSRSADSTGETPPPATDRPARHSFFRHHSSKAS